MGEASFQFPRLLQHHARIPGFVAVLQKRAAAGGKFLSRNKHGVGVWKEASIENGVETRKDHALISLSAFRIMVSPICDSLP